MQLDMHYYGTYAMARAAGLKKDVCKTIATAAQFVDDNAVSQDIDDREDGLCVHIIATAHHATSIQNTDKKDQRKVWVPFHFLPGLEGEEYKDKLICRKNSVVVADVKKHVLEQRNKDYFIELAGIFAHIYADTFSHYGFSGITDIRNSVFQDGIEHLNAEDSILEYLKKKRESFIGKFAELSGLGHGGVFTYPDRPYLNWKFKYEHSMETVTHNNPETFFEGCQALYNFFVEVGEARTDLKSSSDIVTFESISERIREILSLQKPKEDRISKWIEKAKDGSLFAAPEEIPVYEDWNQYIPSFKTGDSDYIKNHKVFHFFQAASNYRTYLLRDLLPSRGLIVG